MCWHEGSDGETGLETLVRLRVEASRHLEGLLKPLEHSEAEEWIERIVEGVAKRNLDSAVVDKETLVSVVQVSRRRRRQSLSPISFK